MRRLEWMSPDVVPADKPPESSRSALGLSRRSLRVLSWIAVIALSDFGTRQVFKLQSDKVYGTLQNPKYKIPSTSKLSANEALAHKLDSWIEAACGENRYFLARLEELRQLENIAPAALVNHDRLGQLCQEFFPPETATGSFEIIDPEPFESEFGDPEILARELFKELTGKELPKIVSVSEQKLERYGGYNQILSHTVVVDNSREYFTKVGIYLHEFGHIASLAREYAGFRSPFFLASHLPTAKAREEAAAYLFQEAAAQLIEDPTLRSLAAPGFPGMLQLHYQGGFDGSEYHAHGIEIADAAVTIFGCLAQAFNHVAYADQLDPTIFEIIAENRRKFSELDNLYQQSHERKKNFLQGLYILGEQAQYPYLPIKEECWYFQ